MRKLVRKLKQNHKCLLNKIQLSTDKIKSANLLIFSNPQNQITEEESEVLHDYIENGGSLLIMASEGGDKKSRGNLNEFLAHYGVKLNDNSVIRTNYYKYYHPKEVLISNGVI